MAASDMEEQRKDTGKQVQGKAGEMGNRIKAQTSQLTEQARDKAKSAIEEQKDRGLGELSGLAEAVRQTSHHLRDQQHEGIAHYAERAAEHIDRVVQYVDSRNVTELLNETERFARRHPEAFLGGAFMLGLLAGRFLKSSGIRHMSESSFSRQEPVTVGSSPTPSLSSS